VTLTEGNNVTGQDLFLVAKKPADSTNSIAGTVVLTGDATDGEPFAGALEITQDGKTLQTTIAKDGAFVFEDVKATGDLKIVVTDVPAGYEQKLEDGEVRNYAGTTIDYLTIRLVPTVAPDPVPAAADFTWLVIVLAILVLAAAAAVVILLVRRKPPTSS
jgi:hypothetical protein